MSDTAPATPAASERPAGFLHKLLHRRRATTEATATDLRAALAEAEAQHAAHRERVDALGAQLGDILLSGDADVVAAHKAAQAEASAAWRETHAIIPALRQRIEAAEAREADASAQAEKTEGERHAAAAAADLALCERAAGELIEAAKRADTATRAVEATNKRLRDAGRADLAVTIPTEEATVDALHRTMTAANPFIMSVRQRGAFPTEWRTQHAAEQARVHAAERAKQDAARARDTPRTVATIVRGL